LVDKEQFINSLKKVTFVKYIVHHRLSTGSNIKDFMNFNPNDVNGQNLRR